MANVTNVSKLSLAKEAEMYVGGSFEGTQANITLAQDTLVKVANDITGVSKLSIAKESEMYVGGTINGTDKKNDIVNIGANSILSTSGFNNIESLTLGKDSILIVTNDSADINLDELSGNWTNGTIYDIQGNVTDIFDTAEQAKIYSGELYSNEWDIYTFDVEDANVMNELVVSGGSGIVVQLAYKEFGSDDWSIDVINSSDRLSSTSSPLCNGNYAIMVGRTDVDFSKDGNEDYSISISLKTKSN